MENLSLDGVEVTEAVETLEGGVLECRDRQGLEVKKVSVGWVALRQNEVLKGDGSGALSPYPPV